jgi:hypothetical protein
MFTVIWNPLGFQVVAKLPTDTKMNSDYCITNILEPLEQKIFPNGRKPHAKRLTIHLDNCSIRTSGASEVFMAEHNMIRLKHPPYSPNRAPSDFYLLPTIKERLTDIQMVMRKTCSLDCANFRMKFPFENWGRYLTLGSNASGL